jgi:GNAT superfamily N-acetyltransferase
MSEKSVHIRRATMNDVDGIEDLFVEVFGKKRPEGSYSWLFYDGPQPGISVVAEENGQIVGHAGTIARRLSDGTQEFFMGTSVDAMTHPDWQKCGINRRLSGRLIEENIKADVGLYGGFSNENSTHTAIKNQERQSLGSVPLLIRPLKIMSRPWRILTASVDPIESQEVVWPEDLDSLCSSSSLDGIGSVRSAAYLKWRYRRPGGVYYLVEHRVEGTLRGIAVIGLRIKGGLKLGFVMEFLSPSQSPEIQRALLKALIGQAKELGCDGLCALSFPGSEMRKTYTRSAFVPTKPGLLREHIDFSLRLLDPKLSKTSLEPKAWHLTWGDTDLV